VESEDELKLCTGLSVINENLSIFLVTQLKDGYDGKNRDIRKNSLDDPA
jgi:hypothetical protein